MKLNAPGTRPQKAAKIITTADGAVVKVEEIIATGTTAKAPTDPANGRDSTNPPSHCPTMATPIAMTSQISEPAGADKNK